MKTFLLLAAGLALVGGCHTSPNAHYFTPPGEEKALRIEVIPLDARSLRYELQVDGAFVVGFGASDVTARPVAVMHRGKKFELKGAYLLGGGMTVVVFADARHAGSFDFRRDSSNDALDLRPTTAN
ncbi:MAG: hypothetical protein JNL39_00780 [Opitutaceae bacterium]|nr:hypothetical protein [Opitutaceae bacterium]